MNSTLLHCLFEFRFYYKNIVNLTHTWERIETISYSGLVKWPYRIHKPLLNRFT